MSISWKVYTALYIAAFVVQYGIFYYLMYGTTGYQLAHMKRLKHKLWWNTVFLLGSVFIWRRIQLLFEHDFNELPYQNDKIHFGKPVQKGSWQRKLISGFTLLFLFCMHFSYMTYYVYPIVPGFLCNFTLICLGVWTHLVCFLVGLGIVNCCVRFANRITGFQPIIRYLTSYKPLKSILLDINSQTVFAIVMSVLFSVLGMYCAWNVKVLNVNVRLDHPKARDLKGLKIALLSDIHVGPNVYAGMVEKVVKLTNEQKPDIIAIDGDLVDGSLEQIENSVAPIKELKAKYGVFFVTGNHEYYYGKVDEWVTYLRTRMNVRVLRNEHTVVQYGSENKSELCLAGVDDPSSDPLGITDHGMNLEKAVGGCEGKPTVLLAHKPQVVPELLMEKQLAKNVQLVLSGHVHAGQLYPVAPIMYFTAPYFHGLYRATPNTQVYVSAGVHFWAAPMKMIGLAEITMINFV